MPAAVDSGGQKEAIAAYFVGIDGPMARETYKILRHQEKCRSKRIVHLQRRSYERKEAILSAVSDSNSEKRSHMLIHSTLQCSCNADLWWRKLEPFLAPRGL